MDLKLWTTEDLRATFVNYPFSTEGIHAVTEYLKRCGSDYFTEQWRRNVLARAKRGPLT